MKQINQTKIKNNFTHAQGKQKEAAQRRQPWQLQLRVFPIGDIIMKSAAAIEIVIEIRTFFNWLWYGFHFVHVLEKKEIVESNKKTKKNTKTHRASCKRRKSKYAVAK